MQIPDPGSLLGDFESEARTHIETIESAILGFDDPDASPGLLDSAFRAAHSIKGTAGFFSLRKIVAVAHELESIFQRVKDGVLTPRGELADVALRGVDCLTALVSSLDNPDAVDIAGVLEELEGCVGLAGSPSRQDAGPPARLPFDLHAEATAKALKNAAKRGQKTYYLDIAFHRGLGQYYNQPRRMVEDITSVGSILEAVVDGRAAEPARLTDEIIWRLGQRDTFPVALLVTSVLERELFLIAVELDVGRIHSLPNAGEEPPAAGEPAKGDAAPAGTQAAPAPAPHRQEPSIRLEVSTVNGLMDLANEMILTRNRLLSFISEHAGATPGLAPVLHDMNRLSGELQEKLMRTRMQPVSTIFARFPRIIRDTAKALGKEMRIEMFGGDVALDKALLDALSDPLTQLVKNAADHGIETPGRRAAVGKPRAGFIRLGAVAGDGYAIIEVTDDGEGIDADALARRYAERGLATPEQLAAMPRAALLRLILEPGLSTAQKVTDLSGRGVGMDIVRTNLEKLGGAIEVESQPGAGTTVRLKVPLMLTVIRSLIVTVSGVRYALPEANVERVVRLWRGMPSRRLECVNNVPVLNLDGWILPLVTMEDIDAKARGQAPSREPFRRAAAGDVAKCVVLRAAGRYFALLIDDAVGSEETLVKPLPLYLAGCRCYTGVTVLGNGGAIVIADAEGILRHLELEGVPKDEATSDAAQENGLLRQILVFRCSGAEHFALDTGLVSRIERVAPAQLQEIGDGLFVNLAGNTVRVLRPEDYAPVQKRDYSAAWLYLLRLAACGEDRLPAGILAGKVLDKVDGDFTPDPSCVESDFVEGTCVHEEKILIFLDSARILAAAETG